MDCKYLKINRRKMKTIKEPYTKDTLIETIMDDEGYGLSTYEEEEARYKELEGLPMHELEEFCEFQGWLQIKEKQKRLTDDK